MIFSFLRRLPELLYGKRDENSALAADAIISILEFRAKGYHSRIEALVARFVIAECGGEVTERMYGCCGCEVVSWNIHRPESR